MAEKACHVFGSTTQVGLTQALGLMKYITGVCVLLLASSASSFAEVRIHAKSSKNSAGITLNPANGKLNTSPATPSSVTAIDHFSIKGEMLFYNGQPSFKANEILAQSAADGTDIVVVRVDRLALGNPLVFIAGHPKQVSRIVVAGFRNGRVAWQHRIAKEAYSSKWQASISPPEA